MIAGPCVRWRRTSGSVRDVGTASRMSARCSERGKRYIPGCYPPTRMKKALILPMLMVVLMSSTAAAQHIDVTWYDLALEVDPGGSPELRGEVSVEGWARVDVQAVTLELSSVLHVQAVRNRAGEPLVFTHAEGRLHVDYPLTSGDRFHFTTVYEGTPASSGFGSWQTGTVSSGTYIWTLSEPYGASDWWPNHDHPSDKADSVRVSVRVPDPIRVGSNGLLTSVVAHGDGTTTWTWEHGYPIASYLVSVAAGTYDVYEQVYIRPPALAAVWGPLDLPILHYVFAGAVSFEGIDDFSGWREVTDMMPLFEAWYGPYPFPLEKYGHAQVTFRGGMEHQTMSSMGNIGLNLVSHELAHQWFGNSVGLGSWEDLWLNEGFATQAEFLHMESDPDRFQGMRAFLFDLYRDRALRARGTLVLRDTTDVADMFDATRVYTKGWMVLRMIRKRVGDDVYRAVLHAYAGADEPGGALHGLTSTRRFQTVLEEVSGRDFGRFFDDWVRVGTGHPVIDMTWEPISGSGGAGGQESAVDVTVRQVQFDSSNIPAFEMPVSFHVVLPDTVLVFDRLMETREQTFRLSIPATASATGSPVETVLFDPEGWALWEPAEIGTGVERGGERTGVPGGRAGRQATRLDVFPNPVGDRVTIRVDAPGNARVMDMTGRTVWSGPLAAGLNEVEVMHLPVGVYVVRTSGAFGLLTIFR